MKYTHSIVILFWASFFSFNGYAQSWQWSKANTGAGIDAWPVATDKSGNVFAAGFKMNPGSSIFDAYPVPTTGVVGAQYQSIVAKYDPDGGFLWARGTTYGNSVVIGITTDPSGNVFEFGTFNSPIIKIGSVKLTNAYAGDWQYYLAKYDAAGNVLWATNAGNAETYFVTFNGISPMKLGVGAIAADKDGNVYVTANFHKPAITIGAFTLTNTDPSGNTDDILLAKYDPSGNVVWANSAGGTKSDDAYAITVTPAGDIYIAGVFGSATLAFGPLVITDPNPLKVAFIARYDAYGNPVWASASGGAGHEYAAGLACDVSDNVYLVGGLVDNSISYSGTAITNPTPGKATVYLVKLDPLNNVSWNKIISSPTGGEAWGFAVATSYCGDVWISGGMTQPVFDTGPNPGTISIDGNLLVAPAASYDPAFIAGFTASGSYLGSVALQSGQDDQSGIACDDVGNVYLCADYNAKHPFSIADHNFAVDTLQDEFLYVAKYAPRSNTGTFKHSDTTLCYNSGMTLYAHGGFQSYIWSDGHNGVAKSVTDTGVFWVLGYDTCSLSTVRDTFKVDGVCDCTRNFFIPNTFTPNGDGQNDIFYPRAGKGITKITTFRVYNRWGTLLFERENLQPNDIANAWDGTYQGNVPLPDVYVYIIDAVCEDGKVINKKGSVTVIR